MRRSAAFPIASPAALPALRAAARPDDFTPPQVFPVASAVAAALVGLILRLPDPPGAWPSRPSSFTTRGQLVAQ